ncbi:MAG: NUDIX hydrolase [Rhodocyclaceae bacterium]|nr:NUDIX hydrolase [Rhodocyclaceae bacterium]
MSAQTRWKPHVTVAAVIARDGRFLMVEENTEEGLQLNQPAGHLEEGESLVDAAVREVLEETAWHFAPSHLVGVYQWNWKNRCYLRFAFCGELLDEEAGRALDDGIVRTVWMSEDELQASRARHRSPLLMQCVHDYLAGQRVPLDVLHWVLP